MESGIEKKKEKKKEVESGERELSSKKTYHDLKVFTTLRKPNQDNHIEFVACEESQTFQHTRWTMRINVLLLAKLHRTFPFSFSNFCKYTPQVINTDVGAFLQKPGCIYFRYIFR